MPKKKAKAKPKPKPERKRKVRLKELKVEMVAFDSIHSNQYNPNRQNDIEFDMLKRSIKEDGFTQPIVVHRESKEIVDGFHRWSACKELNGKKDLTGEVMDFATIPVVFVDMTPEQMRIATLRHNRARGNELPDLTARVVKELEEMNALDEIKASLVMGQSELDRLLEDARTASVLASEELSEAWLPDVSIKRRGDVTMQEDSHDGEEAAWAMSSDAKVADRDREKRIKLAKGEQEKRKILEEKEFFRLTLTFTKEEWVKVKKVLGDKPADRFMIHIDQEYQKIKAAEELVQKKVVTGNGKKKATKKKRTVKQ